LVSRTKKRIINNKKGSLQDLIYIGVGLVSIAITLLLAFTIAANYNTNIQADPAMPATAKTASNTITGYFVGVGDHVFLFITIGLSLAALVLASLVRVHPVFFVFFIIALVILIYVSGIFTNIYEEMAASPQLAPQANQLLFTSFVMSRLPFFIGVIGILLMLVMYKIWRNDG